jgi:hypothetical protein
MSSASVPQDDILVSGIQKLCVACQQIFKGKMERFIGSERFVTHPHHQFRSDLATAAAEGCYVCCRFVKHKHDFESDKSAHKLTRAAADVNLQWATAYTRVRVELEFPPWGGFRAATPIAMLSIMCSQTFIKPLKFYLLNSCSEFTSQADL